MKFLELQKTISSHIFTFLDVAKLFPSESPQKIRMQLSRFAKKGLIRAIKRGLYCFNTKQIDELELANRLYQPSYVSLESALNYYGMIPDIPQAVTSVDLITSKKIKTPLGIFYYAKIKKELFFGFVKTPAPASDSYFNLARPEKALLDYFYLRKVRTVSELRLNLKNLDKSRFDKYAKHFPGWIQKIKL